MSFFAELKRRNVIRVAIFYVVSAWLLLQIADLIFELLLVPDWTLRFIFGALVAAFPFVLFFAWAYELTPEGVKREADVDRTSSIADQTGRRLNLITLGVLAVAVLAYLGGQFLVRSEAPAPLEPETAAVPEPQPTEAAAPANGIAVLPFTDLSPAGDQRYFSHGIAEELLNVLVRIPELQVASRTSSFQFADRDLGIPEIAEILKVRYVLEGSVRKAGETLRITGQLIDAAKDRHLWSDTFDRPLTAENIFAIQDEISTAIVEALADVLDLGEASVEVAAATENLDAYDLYLRARPLYLARYRLDEVDEMLAEALLLDPEFAAAWALRAGLNTLLEEYQYTDLSHEEINARIREYAERALALDPESAVAWAALGGLGMNDTWYHGQRGDYAQILEYHDRAVALAHNNGSARNWRGMTYAQLGYLDRALEDYLACERYEPLYAPCLVNSHVILAGRGQDQLVYDRFMEALDRGVPHALSAYVPTLVRLGKRDLFKLITNADEVLGDWRRHDDLFDALSAPLGNHGDLLAELRDYAERHDMSSVNAGLYLTPFGAYEYVPNPAAVWDPIYRDYRKSLNFKEFMVQIGVVSHWREYGFPPQCRALGDSDFECD